MLRFSKNTGRVPKIPRKVRVGPHIIRVYLVDPFVLHPEGKLFGDYLHEKLRIRIANDACPAMQYSTFIHEVVEAINKIYELDLSHARRTTIESALQEIEPL